MIDKSILERIGNTPLLNIENILVKQEQLNPSGSIKDRIAKYIIEKAEKTKQLKPNYTIVEATSGNTGIAFSFVSAAKGYNMHVVMPKGMSPERKAIMESYGAKVELVHKLCVKCAVDRAKTIAKRSKHYAPQQFENEWNVEENEKLLGTEILKQTKGIKIDAIVAGIGTGGTLIGTAKAIKRKFPNAKVIAVEPEECALLTNNKFGTHKIFGLHKLAHVCKEHHIEGIGDGFIPSIVQRYKHLIDDVITIKSNDATKEAKRIAQEYGCFVGPSSGANLLAAKKLQKKGLKNIVTFFPDSGDRYLKTK